MLSTRDKNLVISILDETLGVGRSLRGNEQAHHCPFCNHHKKKLQVNLETQKWHCWVCDAKGKKIYRLLKKAGTNPKKLQRINEIYEDHYIPQEFKEEDDKPLFLPQEYKSLIRKPNGINPSYNTAIHYLSKRGFGMDDIRRYNIGYCEEGLYSGRIIIPSYDENYKLNYFIARSFYEDSTMKYKNPPVSKNVVMFESEINWNHPITLVEGVFDAMTIKRNTIPLLGKFLSKKLLNKILTSGVSKINILLDSDAQKDALYWTDYLSKEGIEVTNIKPGEKDANEMGFDSVINLIKQSKQTTYQDLIFQKLNSI